MTNPVACLDGQDHKFEARYDEAHLDATFTENAVEKMLDEWSDSDNINSMLGALKNKIYRGDLCVRCGIFRNPTEQLDA